MSWPTSATPRSAWASSTGLPAGAPSRYRCSSDGASPDRRSRISSEPSSCARIATGSSTPVSGNASSAVICRCIPAGTPASGGAPETDLKSPVPGSASPASGRGERTCRRSSRIHTRRLSRSRIATPPSGSPAASNGTKSTPAGHSERCGAPPAWRSKARTPAGARIPATSTWRVVTASAANASGARCGGVAQCANSALGTRRRGGRSGGQKRSGAFASRDAARMAVPARSIQ